VKALRRFASIYGAMAGMTVKQILQYNAWFWVDFFGQILMMIVFVYFWRAIYANTDRVGGMDLQATITYVLLARMLAPMFFWSLILDMGGRMREGNIGIELLRPLDFQLRMFVDMQAGILTVLLRQALPLALVAWLFFDLQVPTDPAVWGAFVVSLLLGTALMFCFDFAFSTLAFYTTEVWGIHVLREGVVNFFSGALLPLAMLPGWLRAIADFLPFGQAFYAPLSLLSGITPVSAAPRVWLVQGLWLVGLALCSRLAWRVAVRRVTVQGG
jgi:ABC-2 type transport system permease protein